jgi:hypothetical protein
LRLGIFARELGLLKPSSHAEKVSTRSKASAVPEDQCVSSKQPGGPRGPAGLRRDTPRGHRGSVGPVNHATRQRVIMARAYKERSFTGVASNPCGQSLAAKGASARGRGRGRTAETFMVVQDDSLGGPLRALVHPQQIKDVA